MTAFSSWISPKSDCGDANLLHLKKKKMARSKANRYELECQILYHFFRAISHPARQKIIKKLCKDDPCQVNELSKNHPISRSTFSGHLKILMEAHMIFGKEEFPHTYYSLNRDRLLEVKKIINDFFDSLDL